MTDRGFLDGLKESFGLGGIDPKQLSAPTLAYVGDAVYELVVRTMLVERLQCKPNRLNSEASSIVKASAQSQSMARIKPMLDDEEIHIFKRGRNAHTATMAKNAKMSDYRRATGFEALMGYLFLEERYDRLFELIKAGLPGERKEDGAAEESRGQ